MEMRIDAQIIRELANVIIRDVPELTAVSVKGVDVLTEKDYPYLIITRDGGIDTTDFICNLQLLFDVHGTDSYETHEIANDVVEAVKTWWGETKLNVMDRPMLNGIDDDGDDKTGEQTSSANMVVTYLNQG